MEEEKKSGIIHNDSTRMTEVWVNGRKLGEIADDAPVEAKAEFWR